MAGSFSSDGPFLHHRSLILMSLVIAIARLDGQRAEQDSLEQSLFVLIFCGLVNMGSAGTLFCKRSLIPLVFLHLTI